MGSRSHDSWMSAGADRARRNVRRARPSAASLRTHPQLRRCLLRTRHRPEYARRRQPCRNGPPVGLAPRASAPIDGSAQGSEHPPLAIRRDDDPRPPTRPAEWQPVATNAHLSCLFPTTSPRLAPTGHVNWARQVPLVVPISNDRCAATGDLSCLLPMTSDFRTPKVNETPNARRHD